MVLADCINIFKKSIVISVENKRLWWISLMILAVGELANFLTGVIIDQNLQAKIATSKLSFLTEIVKFINQNFEKSILILIATLIILFVVYAGLRAGLLIFIKSVLRETSLNFFRGIQEGMFSSLKLVRLNLTAAIFLFISLIILIIPIEILFSKGAQMGAGILGIGALFIFAPLALIVYLILIFAQIYAIQHKLSARESARNAYALLSNNFKSSVIAFFAFNILTIATFLMLILLFSMISNIIFFAGYFIENKLFEYSHLAGTVLFFLLVRMLMIASQQCMWVLFFEKISLKKETVIEETEKAKEIMAEEAI